jgi:putative phage-type endonuclease
MTVKTAEAFERLPIITPDNPNEQSPERDAWLADRKNGIGSSDAAAACGLSRYKTELQLWMEKTGQLAEEDLSGKRRVRMGNRLEQVVAEEYELETGRKLQRMRNVLQSKEFPFMRASLDRVVVGERRLVELKTAGYWAAKQDADWGPDGTDLTPIEYAIQVAHQLIVTRWEAGDLTVMIDYDDLRIYNFEPNEKLFDLVIERETDFWRRVVEGDPPAPRTLEDTLLKYPHAQERPVYASMEIAQLVGDMQHFKRQIGEIQEQFDARKVKVQEFMGDGDVLFYLDSSPIATWKNVSRSTIDVKRLKAEQPEIAKSYSRTSESRTFYLIGDKP